MFFSLLRKLKVAEGEFIYYNILRIGSPSRKENIMSRKDSKGRVLQKGESYREKEGRYVYRYVERGGKTVSIYAKTLAELRQKEKDLTKAQVNGVNYLDNRNITLNAVFDTYISLKKNLKQSTKTNYVYMYNKYVRSDFGRRIIGTIRYSDVLAYYLSLFESGFKPNSLDNIHTILHPTFQLAVRNNYILNNPSDGVMSEIKKHKAWEKPKRHALTIEEQEAFMGYIKKSPTYRHWLPLFTVFLGTGCRVGEVIGLRWDDVDFKNNVISINHNLIYRLQDDGSCEFHITTPKTEAGVRLIPMLSEVKKALLEEKEKQLASGPSKAEVDGYKNFCFLNKCDNVHNPHTINRAIKRICRDFNIEEDGLARKERREPLIIRDFSVHNLRHTFCTRFCETESNIKVIQEIMGHADVSTTMGIYAEATEAKKKEVFSNLEGKLKIS